MVWAAVAAQKIFLSYQGETRAFPCPGKRVWSCAACAGHAGSWHLSKTGGASRRI